ncbi:MAG: hypothetical protein QOE05_1708 [Actinomycetota bacterium]|jgi:hypothetical protein|nr:hypothetical protein [Actinomycetota bacterium]
MTLIRRLKRNARTQMPARREVVSYVDDPEIARSQMDRLETIVTARRATDGEIVTRITKDELETLREEVADVERAQRAAAAESDKLFFG